MSVEEMALSLPRAEKLRLMEALWENLSETPEAIPSPAWHEDTLRHTDRRLESGEERIIDWEAAKGILGKSR